MKQFQVTKRLTEEERLKEICGEHLIGYTSENGMITEFRLNDAAPDTLIDIVEEEFQRPFRDNSSIKVGCLEDRIKALEDAMSRLKTM